MICSNHKIVATYVHRVILEFKQIAGGKPWGFFINCRLHSDLWGLSLKFRVMQVQAFPISQIQDHSSVLPYSVFEVNTYNERKQKQSIRYVHKKHINLWERRSTWGRFEYKRHGAVIWSWWIQNPSAKMFREIHLKICQKFEVCWALVGCNPASCLHCVTLSMLISKFVCIISLGEQRGSEKRG